MRHRSGLIGSLTIPLLLAGSFGNYSIRAESVSQKPTENKKPGFEIPKSWTRHGVVLERQRTDGGVSGDPCIVWDDAIRGWRMVLFYDPGGHAQAICTNREDLGPGQWRFEGRLPVANPEAVGAFHKPFIVMDPDHVNQAAKIDGRYCLLVVSFKSGHKPAGGGGRIPQAVHRDGPGPSKPGGED